MRANTLYANLTDLVPTPPGFWVSTIWSRISRKNDRMKTTYAPGIADRIANNVNGFSNIVRDTFREQTDKYHTIVLARSAPRSLDQEHARNEQPRRKSCFA